MIWKILNLLIFISRIKVRTNAANQENLSDVQFYTEQGQKVPSLDIEVEKPLGPGDSIPLIARICCLKVGEKGFVVEVSFIVIIFSNYEIPGLGAYEYD